MKKENTKNTKNTDLEKIEEMFNRYAQDFKKSPIKDVKETEDGLSIDFEDVFYEKLQELKNPEETVSEFIGIMLKDFLKEQEV